MTALMKEKPTNEILVTNVIDILKHIQVDGETMEHILKKVGQDDQMLQQLVMGATNDQLNPILEERTIMMDSPMVDIFVDGEWDISSEPPLAPLVIYRVGTVHRIRANDLNIFIDGLEAKGYDSYLCPALFKNPNWNGNIVFE